MNKINPFFKVESKTYEIKRTRFLECKYEEITQNSGLSEENEKAFSQYIKLQIEYEKFLEKFKNAEDDYLDDILNSEKKAKYEAFKNLVDNKYDEFVNFTLTHKDFSTKIIEDKAYENGVKVLIAGLCEQHNVTESQAIEIWDKFVDNLGLNTAKEWILHFSKELFGKDDEEENEDPFLKMSRAKEQQRMDLKKGLSKVKK